MTVRARTRMLPVAYPAAFIAAYLLNLVIVTGVSPYAGARPLLVGAALGIGLPWLFGLWFGDRHLAGLAAGMVLLSLLAPPSPAVLLLTPVGLTLLVLAGRRVASRPDTAARRGPWRVATRILNGGAAIVFVAVLINAVQLDRIRTVIGDLAAEFPLRALDAPASTTAGLPNMYFILLDGYPRVDKLRSVFGIDGSWFTDGLAARGFAVAARSRSNHTSTRVALTQLLNYELTVPGLAGARPDLWRERINSGRVLEDVHRLGYEVIAISPGFEHVTLRRADRFIDTGEPNEFEWAVLQTTSLGAVLERLQPSIAADAYRSRMIDAFRVTARLAMEAVDRPRLVLAHIAGPHSPLVFDRDGRPTDVRGLRLRFDDAQERAALGWAEFSRRLGGQVQFVGDQTLKLVDTIVASDPGAVVVVFSDHGSGATDDPDTPGIEDGDLRTANLLAVRSPRVAGIIDDRSTLANVLPRLLRGYAGVGPADAAETIVLAAEDPEHARIFLRPD